MLVAVEDGEEGDVLYEAITNYDDAACMMTRCLPPQSKQLDITSDVGGDALKRNRARARTSGRMIFSPSVGVYDNAASRSLPKKSELLRTIV